MRRSKYARMTMNWFVVHTKAHRERLAASNLGLIGIEAFCPEVRERKMVRRCLRLDSIPLFSGYIFARFDLIQQYRAVIFARGVKGLVAFGSMPATIEHAVIESIKARVQDRNLTLCDHELKTGQVVQICKGPLSGIEAIFERKLSGNQRAVLLLRMVSYQARVLVDLKNIVNF
ncbi:MAG: transcription termination/antitermination protein NusG [Nitrospiraceae bacterium]